MGCDLFCFKNDCALWKNAVVYLFSVINKRMATVHVNKYFSGKLFWALQQPRVTVRNDCLTSKSALDAFLIVFLITSLPFKASLCAAILHDYVRKPCASCFLLFSTPVIMLKWVRLLNSVMRTSYKAVWSYLIIISAYRIVNENLVKSLLFFKKSILIVSYTEFLLRLQLVLFSNYYQFYWAR